MDVKKFFINSLWKEFNPESERSIAEDFRECEGENDIKILEYLKTGKIYLVAAGEASDPITGKMLGETLCMFTDGEYSWSTEITYCVQHYHLRLPMPFEKKILEC